MAYLIERKTCAIFTVNRATRVAKILVSEVLSNGEGQGYHCPSRVIEVNGITTIIYNEKILHVEVRSYTVVWRGNRFFFFWFSLKGSLSYILAIV